MERRASVPLRVLQAVGLAALTTCLIALYEHQEKLTARDMMTTRHSVYQRRSVDEQQHTVNERVKHRTAPAPSAPNPPPQKSKELGHRVLNQPASLPEPWGSHHMYARPGPYDPCPSQWVEGTWTSSRSMGNATLPLTLQAQREIYAHQHPPDCSKVKYLKYNIGANGLGAVFHVAGVALQLALDLNRIYIEAPGTFLTGSPQCKARNADTLDSCYFLPFSSCRPTAAQIAKAVSLNMLRNADADANSPNAPMVVVASHDSLFAARAKPPVRFAARLAATPIQPSKHYYWWRAQSVAYMLRLRPDVKKDLEERRKRTLSGPAPAPGCISVHVRHGDKGVEAQTFDDAAYDETAARLRSLAPSRFTDQLFVSTEDPHTITYFVNVSSKSTARDGKGRKWRTGYTAGVPRKPDRTRSNLSYMAEIGYYEEVLNSLLNLDLAMECSAFVGSIYSNWVRLIDELRSTLRCKADAVFADVFYQNPHEMDVNW